MRGLFKKQDQTDRSRISDTQTQAYNRLSASLLTDFMDSQADGNIVFSPYSIQMLLSLLIASTAGETRREVERYLCGTDDAAQASEMVQLLQKMQTDFARSNTFGSANAVLADKSFKKRIRKEYVQLVERSFQGQVIASGDVVKDTNMWVREKTRGMIEQVLKEAPQELAAILLNAVAFDGEWERTYSEDEVLDMDFHNEDGTTSCVSMLTSTEQIYIEDSNVIGFIKPYKDTNYSFMGILPRKKGKKALHKAAEQLNISALYNQRSDEMVSALLPEFDSKYEIRMQELLRKRGMQTVFSPQADFSPMSDAPLLLDEILHKARIEVDRKGTRAAAVTMGFVCYGSLPPKRITVHLDRPFIYAVVHNETGLPIFVGAVRRL